MPPARVLVHRPVRDFADGGDAVASLKRWRQLGVFSCGVDVAHTAVDGGEVDSITERGAVTHFNCSVGASAIKKPRSVSDHM